MNTPTVQEQQAVLTAISLGLRQAHQQAQRSHRGTGTRLVAVVDGVVGFGNVSYVGLFRKGWGHNPPRVANARKRASALNPARRRQWPNTPAHARKTRYAIFEKKIVLLCVTPHGISAVLLSILVAKIKIDARSLTGSYSACWFGIADTPAPLIEPLLRNLCGRFSRDDLSRTVIYKNTIAS